MIDELTLVILPRRTDLFWGSRITWKDYSPPHRLTLTVESLQADMLTGTIFDLCEPEACTDSFQIRRLVGKRFTAEGILNSPEFLITDVLYFCSDGIPRRARIKAIAIPAPLNTLGGFT